MEEKVVFERANFVLKELPKNVKGQKVTNHYIIDIIGEDVHYWSPQLNFRIEEKEYAEGITVISGLIGPRPPVWTMFMFIYFSMGVLGFFISSMGMPKLMEGEFSLPLLAFPIAIALMLTAYKAGKYGEKLGADQTVILKEIVERIISSEAGYEVK